MNRGWGNRFDKFEMCLYPKPAKKWPPLGSSSRSTALTKTSRSRSRQSISRFIAVLRPPGLGLAKSLPLASARASSLSRTRELRNSRLRRFRSFYLPPLSLDPTGRNGSRGRQQSVDAHFSTSRNFEATVVFSGVSRFVYVNRLSTGVSNCGLQYRTRTGAYRIEQKNCSSPKCGLERMDNFQIPIQFNTFMTMMCILSKYI
jgi:hypothetical protein